MPSSPRTVFVLGAGFTRGFLPRAPLLTDDYQGDDLETKFEGFEHASRIPRLERKRNSGGRINIERLMTRLDGRMPYDSEQRSDKELDLLLSELLRCFHRRIQQAKEGEWHRSELADFARSVAENGHTCITFNYDDVLDQALWEVKRVLAISGSSYWHPDGGYGFLCRPAETCVQERNVFVDQTSMRLLKLHGSINWRVRRGYRQPYPVDAIVHHEGWFPPVELLEADPEQVESHLEPDPFIVPPVLVKSTLVEQPILRLAWSLAYKELERAEQVIFVGYSFPATDMAGSFLFGEALQNLKLSQLKVVNLASDESEEQVVRESYRKVFSGLSDDQFDFKGALEWSHEWCKQAGARNS